MSEEHGAADEAGQANLPPAPRPMLINREHAILAFNRRVLAQAERADVPLLERLRYVTIVSSNLDEFFEVRMAEVLEASRQPGSRVTPAGVVQLSRAVRELIAEQYAVFNEQVMPGLQREGVVVLNHAERDAANRLRLCHRRRQTQYDRHGPHRHPSERPKARDLVKGRST